LWQRGLQKGPISLSLQGVIFLITSFLPRLRFRFDRKSLGRLRMLIDASNRAE
jgi:hypothetical protein